MQTVEEGRGEEFQGVWSPFGVLGIVWLLPSLEVMTSLVVMTSFDVMTSLEAMASLEDFIVNQSCSRKVEVVVRSF